MVLGYLLCWFWKHVLQFGSGMLGVRIQTPKNGLHTKDDYFVGSGQIQARATG